MIDVSHKQAIATAMGIISGQDGVPMPGDYDRAASALSSAQVVPFAKAKLAALTAMGCGVPRDRDRACALYFDAVVSGFPPLLRDMAVINDGARGDKGLTRSLLMRAASSGDHMAADLILAWERREPPVSASAIDSAALKTSLAKIFHAAPVIQPSSLSPDLPVFAHVNALTPLQCDYLMMSAAPLLQPSKVVDGDHSEQAGFRTSDGAAFLPARMDLPVLQIITKLASLAGAAPEQGEFLALLRYRPGQEYRPHHDYLPEDKADYAKVKRSGQRRMTVLTYLNNGYHGGETDFPKLNISHNGGQGDSLVFANIDETSKPQPQSLHAGLPVSQGEKWLITLWVREKRFWPWPAKTL
ncbi:prolyl hydroxylase family protein [Fretibacter rubidus]|uniref:prolyl hydroxylase family protein n=1 Tax=Fretibacter rubidus TaxID=570162 RepID=UPI003529DDDF